MKRIVTLGGGTGTFVVLTALRTLPEVSLTALVSGADDGGSAGHLRDAYGFLPAGDARQALVALAEDESVLRDLFAYRFGKGNIAGHNLGNLFLTALTDMLGSDTAAVEEASRILRICGRVLSVTETPATLVAHLENGDVLVGEHIIDAKEVGRSRIVSVTYQENTALTQSARTALLEADAIILGPGDLYTSTAAALLADGARDAIVESSAKLVYIVNLFSKAGQTDGMSATEQVGEITKYAGRAPDIIFLNTTDFAPDVLARYSEEGECPVPDSLPVGPHIVRADLASVHTVPALPNDPVPRSLVRHDSAKLAQALGALFI